MAREIASGGAARPRVIAIVQAAGRRIGIDGEHVVQAVVVPPDMAAVPRRAGGIVGVMVHGEQLVPVVRLENWLEARDDAEDDGAPVLPATSAEARIVILGDGALVVGLLVEAVVGMQRCPAGALARLFHDDRPDEVFAGAVRVAADAPPIALLEPARLARLAGVWCAAAGVQTRAAAKAPQATEAAAPADGPTERVNLGVFRIGDLFVGIDVAAIGELVRTPALRPAPLRHPSTRGLCEWRDRVLPVVDIGGLLGALPDRGTPPWMCVVRHGDVALGVLVHDIIELQGAELAPLDDASAGPLVRRELPIARGLLQVIATAALMASCPESGIGLRREAKAWLGAQPTSPHTWLVFEAGGAYATRIDRVQEIVPLPADLRPRLEAGAAVSFAWRGHAVPVRGLFAQAGAGPAAADARLLVIVVDGTRRVAVPIAGVRRMIGAGTATLARVRVGARVADVVSTAASSPERASYEVVDLLARAD